jgi:hypothetical protein
VIPGLREMLESGSNSQIGWLKDGLKPCPDVVDLIAEAIIKI